MRRSRVRFPLLASSRKLWRIEGFRLFLRFEKEGKNRSFLRAWRPFGDQMKKYKDSHIYYVDMNNALNKSFVSDESNSSASSAEELKINGPTLINFADGKIVEYVEGKDRIIDYLS